MDIIASLIERFLRRIGARALTGFGLLALLNGIAAFGIAGLAGDSVIAGSLSALLALILGWLAARSRPVGWCAAPWLGAAGLLWTGLTTGRLADPLLSLTSAAWQSLRADGHLSPAVPALAGEFARQAGERAGSVFRWLTGILSAAPVDNAEAAALVWALLLWLAAAWGAWWLRRRVNGLAAALPVVGLLALTLGYTRTSVGLLFPALAALFGLLAWSSYIRRERGWLHTQTDFAEDVPLDVAAWALVVSIGLAGMAATAARPSPQDALVFSRSFLVERTVVVERLGRSLGLSARQPVERRAAGMPAEMPRQHLLGGGLALSGRHALALRTIELPEAARHASLTLPYLRQAAYDRYTGRGWSTSPTFPQTYPPDAGLPLPSVPGWPVVIEIQPSASNRLQIIYPGELLSVDTGLRIDWRIPPAEWPSTPDDPPDAFAASFESLPPSSGYRLSAWVTPADAPGLRSAGQSYPGLVRTRYLQVPARLPERVRALAAGLVARSPNPYDRALILEAYLRNYAYRLDLPPPPANRDVVDYFLFDLKAGYCDYNASAMVILARLAGIPARLAAGYALPTAGGLAGLQPGDPTAQMPEGTGSLAAGELAITEDYAHSWPELYFPGYGWVAFEPTGGRQARRLPATLPPEALTPQLPPVSAYPLSAWTPPPPPEERPWPVTAVILAFLVLAIVLAWQVDRLRWRGAAGLQRSFAAMRRLAVRLGHPVYPGTTPGELGTALAQPEARRLAATYAAAKYAPAPPSPNEVETSRRDWLRLRKAMWARLIRKFAFSLFHPRSPR